MGEAIISRPGATKEYVDNKKIDINHGGTGADTAEQARRNLSVPFRSIFAYGLYDINNLVDTGFYILAHDCKNVPPTTSSYTTWGLMVYPIDEANTSNFAVFQMCVPTADSNQKSSVWIRQKYYYNSTYTWTDWKDISQGNSVEVVQELGQSETAVISQKAMTDSILNPEISTGSKVKLNSESLIGKGATNVTMIDSRYDYALGSNTLCISGYGHFSTPVTNAVILGQSASAYSNSVAVGTWSQALLSDNVAIGYQARCGSGSNDEYSVCVGSNSYSLKKYNVALGYKSKATESSVVSVGDGSDNAYYGTRRIINVSDPINSQDCATKNYVDSNIPSAVIGTNMDIDISPSGSDETGDGSSLKPYATLAKALSLISGKTINALVSVYIASGTYDEGINLVNYSGSGEIRLLGSSSNPPNFKSCRINDNTLRMIEIHDINIGSGSTSTMYVRQNTCYMGLHHITFNRVYISSSASNMIISDCTFSNLSTAIYASPSGGAGGSGYDGTGQIVLKSTNIFTDVTTAVNVSGGSMLVLSTSPTLNGAKLTKTNGGMIIYPNGTFSEN